MMGVIAERLAISGEAAPITVDLSGLIQSEQKRLFLLCYRMLGDRDEAASATQDAFLKAHRALGRQAGLAVDDPSKWLVRIAVNTCLDRLRSRAWRFWRRRPAASEELAALSSATAPEPTAEDRVYAREIRHRVEEALARLSARQRAVFTLRHYEDRSIEEVAEILQLDTGTVKAHMSRALVKLRVELHDLYRN